MLGFWHCRRLMGPPNGGLFHGGRFGSGALFVGGKVLFAGLAGPFGRWKGSVRFCSGGFFVGWKGSVRQAAGGASFIQRKGSVRSYSFHPWSRIDSERVRGAPRRAPDTPGSRPTKPPLRGSLASISSHQVGRDTASCLPRPQARVHAGLTWLVNSGSAILMPVPTPLTLNFLCFTGLFLFL